MENATKALIIAGAILVSILLVTMGITLLSGTNGLTDSSKNQMSQLEVSEFNGRLEVGIGKNVTGSNVKTMLETIAAKVRDDESFLGEGCMITVECLGTPLTKDNINENIDKIKPTTRYEVQATKNNDSGMYDTIKILNKPTNK